MTPPDSIPYRRFFPWLHLFRAIGLAFSVRQLLVGAGAIGVLSLGQALMERIDREERPDSASTEPHVKPLEDSRLVLLRGIATETAKPWGDVARPIIAVLVPGESTANRLKGVGEACWKIIVWSLFGLVLSRLAVRRFARDEQGSLRKTIRFGVTRWIYSIVSPLLPSAASLLIILVAVIVAFPSRIPGIGPALAVISSPVLVICSLLSAYLLIAVLVGWPLMVTAIATDDCDGFGGLSRSYSLWTGRPWYFTWCWVVAGCAGLVAMTLASLMIVLSQYISDLIIGVGIGDSPAALAAATATQDLMAFVIQAYGISFFWTCATIVYALLRQSVDAMPLEIMASDDDERPERDPLPVVGMPAMQ